ncbi:MAG: homoserine dehydrogenase [Cytophagales bacterium]|nr:homoserine dehydrogenase [Cytophagales bacterium]
MKKIGLFGFGCVAQGFYEAITQQAFEAEVSKICIKNPDKERGISPDLFTTDPRAILDDPEIDVVIELIDDAGAAREIVFETLKKGIPTISANKKMIAENLEKLVELRHVHGTTFLYEGAVAGAIPILQTLRNYLVQQPIEEVRAILNGSTNFILSKMKQEGISYEAALEQAQSLGFAETDPKLDVQGYDPVYKAVIIAYHAYGAILKPDQIYREGIDQLSSYLQQQGRKEYAKVKLVASIGKDESGVKASVRPLVLDATDPLYPVDFENNAIQINGAFSGPQLIIGKGAGSLPTGYAVLGDLKEILERERVLV